MTSISVENLRVDYGRRSALDSISLAFGEGVTALVGANGSGKTTLIKVLATLQRPSSGTVAIGGERIVNGRGRRNARRELGYVPQSPEFPQNYTVAEAVAYGAWLHKVTRSDVHRRVGAALAAVGLSEQADQRLKTLSGGTRQRAYIAQAIVHKPKILLLDEATVGVDAEQRVGLRTLVRDLGQGRTVLLSTHITEDIELLADRVVALNAGTLSFDGSYAELVEQHASDSISNERPVESALRNLFRLSAKSHPKVKA